MIYYTYQQTHQTTLENISEDGEKAPKINKLGSKEWENTKNKVKSNLREVARNLIELYAAIQKVT